MTTDDLINLIVFWPGHRTVSVTWIRGGCESWVLRNGPGKVFGKDYGVILHLAKLFEGMLECGAGPITLQHDPHPKGHKLPDDVVEFSPTRVFQFETADGQWQQVSPSRVRKRFHLASVVGRYSFGWLEA